MKTNKYTAKYICLVSFLHIHTKYLDLQACKKLAHRRLRRLMTVHGYQCERKEIQRLYSERKL